MGKESQEVQDQVAQGIFPNSCKSLPSTTVLQYNGLERVLGYIQQYEIEEGRGHKLVDGRLQLWQFFAYGQDKHFTYYRPTEFAKGIFIFQNKFSHSVSVLYLYSQVSRGGWTVLKVLKNW